MHRKVVYWTRVIKDIQTWKLVFKTKWDNIMDVIFENGPLFQAGHLLESMPLAVFKFLCGSWSKYVNFSLCWKHLQRLHEDVKFIKDVECKYLCFKPGTFSFPFKDTLSFFLSGSLEDFNFCRKRMYQSDQSISVVSLCWTTPFQRSFFSDK